MSELLAVVVIVAAALGLRGGVRVLMSRNAIERVDPGPRSRGYHDIVHALRDRRSSR